MKKLPSALRDACKAVAILALLVGIVALNAIPSRAQNGSFRRPSFRRQATMPIRYADGQETHGHHHGHDGRSVLPHRR